MLLFEVCFILKNCSIFLDYVQQIKHQIIVTGRLYCDFEVFLSEAFSWYKYYERFHL